MKSPKQFRVPGEDRPEKEEIEAQIYGGFMHHYQ